MLYARRFLVVIALLATIGFLAAPAAADWKPEDGHKMHYPQLPDPSGWDVRFDSTVTLADDWKCSATGPVSDVHLWFSWLSDQPVDIRQVHVSIHRDIPAGTGGKDYSRPVYQPEWTHDFQIGEFKIVDAGTGAQGWYDPVYEIRLDPDHENYYQLNITNIQDPFIQQEGTIYWLDLSLVIDPPGLNFDPYGPAHVGWKTSLDHFNDYAVYFDSFQAMDWVPIGIPTADGTGVEFIDMAFVITPEPGTFALLAAAGIGALLFVWRKRRAG